MVDGVLVRYTPGAPAWANAAVVGLYADDVIPAGTTVVLEW
jgi:hypothetical protein